MPGSLGVWLGERRVGTMTNVAGDYNLFSFAAEYLEDGDRPILSQSLLNENGDVIRVVPRTHTVAPPFFANLLPEESTLMRSVIARQRRIAKARDFPFLRALGKDLPGAVVVRDLDVADEPVADPGAADSADGMPPIRFSLAGVQLKFSARMLDDRFFVTLDDTDGSWIVKMPTNAYPRLPENEFAMMTLARAIGLDVPQIQLRDLDSVTGLPAELPGLRAGEPRRVYAIERFDRGPGGARVHVEDFNQIAGQKPEDKYEHKATHFVGNVVAALCEPKDVDEFVRRLVFGICTGNDDMHLKNWAIVYPDGRNAALAPMYDFVCSRAYYPHGELALSVGGVRDFARVDRDTMRAFALRAELSPRRAVVLTGEVVESIRAAWPGVRAQIADETLVETLERHFAAVPLMQGR
jgi:serine/threonine-protein kinase HipA